MKISNVAVFDDGVLLDIIGPEEDVMHLFRAVAGAGAGPSIAWAVEPTEAEVDGVTVIEGTLDIMFRTK